MLLAAFALPLVALAHAELESASPPDGAVLDSPPTEIVLTFTEALDPVKSHMELNGPDGTQVAAGVVDPANEKAMRIDPPELEPGAYEIRSTAFAAHDGALKRETLTFTITEPSPTPTATPTPAPSASAVPVPVAIRVAVGEPDAGPVGRGPHERLWGGRPPADPRRPDRRGAARGDAPARTIARRRTRVSRAPALRLAVVAAVAALLLAGPAATVAHSLDATYQSRLPLVVYLVGAALAVGLSFAFLLLADVRADPPTLTSPGRLPPAWLRTALRAIGLIGWSWIVVQGILGGDSAGDVSTLFLWVYGWVGVASISALVGPIWHWLDPFATLFDIGAAVARRLGVHGWDPADYPARLARWPAVVGLVFFVWLELVGAGGGPSSLFIVLVGYTAFTLAMMAQFGRDAWRRNGETFSVWFRLLNRLAPFGLVDDEGHVQRRPFASGLLLPGWTTADIVLVAIGTGSILYDGLSQTTPWFSVFGAPAVPIETLQLAGLSRHHRRSPRWPCRGSSAPPRPVRGCCRSPSAT